jgi:hypothetical protein
VNKEEMEVGEREVRGRRRRRAHLPEGDDKGKEDKKMWKEEKGGA